jgi:hypothetical protein
MLLAFLPKYSLMEVGIKVLPDHFHPSDTLLFQNLHKLFVQALITAMQGLSLLSFRI